MQTEEYAKMRALEDHYWWFVSRRRLARSLLQRYAPRARRVLDLGCGTGAFLQELASKEAVGLDFSEDALAFCSERKLGQVVLGDAQRLPLKAASFEAVVTLDTLEHVPDDTLALNEIARVLRPGGVVVVNVPAFKFLWGPHDVALMHFRRYTKSHLVERLQQAGLQIEKVNYSVFFLFPVVVLIRLLERMRKGPAQVRLPSVPSGLNRLLVILQDIETWLVQRCPLPWGSSVVAVARKPE